MTLGIAIDPSVAGAAAGASGTFAAPRPALAAIFRHALVGPRWFGVTDHVLSTPAAFLTAGDRSSVARSGNASGKGGAFIAATGSKGATHAVATGAALTNAPSAFQR